MVGRGEVGYCPGGVEGEAFGGGDLPGARHQPDLILPLAGGKRALING